MVVRCKQNTKTVQNNNNLNHLKENQRGTLNDNSICNCDTTYDNLCRRIFVLNIHNQTSVIFIYDTDAKYVF